MKAIIYFIPVMLFVSLNLTGCGNMSNLERVSVYTPVYRAPL